jgi:hypothetical protein
MRRRVSKKQHQEKEQQQELNHLKRADGTTVAWRRTTENG